MATDNVHLLILLLAFICTQLVQPNVCDGALASGCISVERSALLEFKQGLKDPNNRLSSWMGEECCIWEGVTCSNHTGHVVKLDLRRPQPLCYVCDDPYENMWRLGGELSPSLLGLKHLKYLDLSMNNFGGANVPEFMGSFHQLQYLNLSSAGLGGALPHHLGNLSNLQYLDLYNYFDPYLAFSIDDALWLSGLSSLKHLNMRRVQFRNGAHWLQALNMLPSIAEIYLSFCEIPSIPLSLPHVNFSSLSVLDLSFNYINSTIPTWLFNLSSLEYLNLSDNSFHGHFSPAFGKFASLKDLNLASNDFLQGGIPSSFRNLCKLQRLELLGINISRDLSEFDDVFSGCMKTSLEILDLSRTGVSGQLPEWLYDLRNLKLLGLDYNRISGPIPVSLGQLASLQELYLGYNQLNGTVPESLGWLSELIILYLGSNTLEGVLFEAHLDNLTKLEVLDVSGNQISGQLPNLMHLNNLDDLDLSSNYFDGPLPYFPPSLETLDLSNNTFSGSILPGIFMSMPNLIYLSLSKNNLSGELPSSICQLQGLVALDLSKNLLSGELPNCWNLSSNIVVLDFSSNNISGGIPESMCSISSLRSLHLSNNRLSGELPLSLKYCAELILLDVGHNELKGEIPTWIGENLTSLEFLQLRSNKFAGNIPPNLSRLSDLQVLDLADNEISGTIPSSVGNFTAMKVIRKFPGSITDAFESGYQEKMPISIKGNTLEYDKLLSLMNILDLSDNNLFGGIPEELMSLVGLFSLNLSGNHLTGEITEMISSLQQLESLDLSRNNLSGAIPSNITALAFLGSLNLSYNNLSGKIPLGRFDENAYIGNPDLCGLPLNRSCDGIETTQGQNSADKNEMMIWLYMSMAPGFVVGFWAVWGTLLLNKKWNRFYFRFIDNMFDKLYVFTLVKLGRTFKGHSCSCQG